MTNSSDGGLVSGQPPPRSRRPAGPGKCALAGNGPFGSPAMPAESLRAGRHGCHDRFSTASSSRGSNSATARRHAVRLLEGARPSLLRVPAHLRGRGAADRRRHDRARPPRSRQSVGQDVDRGDVTAALASAEVAYDEVFTTAAVTNNPMGLFATVALREGNRLTVHDVSQWPTMARKTLAKVFDLPETDVRVLVPYLGGGFGAGLRTWPHVIDRARGLGRRSPGQAGGDPAVDVHIRRPPAGDNATGAGRCHPRWSTGGHRSRVHLDDRRSGRRRRRARHGGHRQRLLLPERRDTRPAGAAAHSKPRWMRGPVTSQDNVAYMSRSATVICRPRRTQVVREW
jgi:hypothetical protein